MKNKTLFLVLFLFAVLSAPVVATPLNQNPPEEQQFTSVVDDLPLMPGLKAEDDKDVLFVEPHAGRIAETEAKGEVTIDDVYNFYRHSLPHLGWKAVDGRTYEREGERLRIDAETSGKITTVQFTIKPITANE